jgi:hypothetical protein
MASVTLTNQTPQNSITLSVDGANNSVAISQTNVTPSISMSLTSAGEANSGVNVGTGAGVYKTKVGIELHFRSIVGGTGVTVTENANDITIDRDALTTDDVSEGSNLYYTDARARAAISATGDLSYNSTTGVISYTQPTNVSEFTNDAGYLTAETNDLTAAVTWANVPDANITQSSVTQHQAALQITESQITDLDHYTSSDFDTDFAGKTTTDLAEGTNLYYTDARVNTYLTTNSYATQTYVNTQIANLVDSAPGTLDTLNELAAALGDDPNFATTVTNSIATKLAIADFSSYFDTDFALKTTTDLSEGTNLYYTDARARASVSVTQATASGNGTLAYNNTNGVFTYTPPDLSPYLTAETNDLTAAVTWANVPDANITQSSVTQHQAALSITESQISDLDHYTNSDVDVHLNTATATTGLILSWNGTDYAWVSQSAGGGGIALTDLSVTTATASGGGTLSYNNTTGVFTFTPPDLSSYLTSFTETNDLTTAVIWANVPDVNITQSSVTQHQAALVITESQISDLDHYNSTDFDTDLATKTTTDLTEGTNLYYTDTRANAAIDARVTKSFVENLDIDVDGGTY